MRAREGLSVLAAVGVLFVSQRAFAECTMDTDCKGDRICEQGVCVSPTNATPAPAAPAAPAAPPPVAVSAPAATAAPRPALPEDPPVPRMERHSKAMMTGGIVMVSVAPLALLVAGISALEQDLCEIGHGDTSYSGSSAGVSVRAQDCSSYDTRIYNGLISALVLVGVGVPLIVVGAKKEPVERTSVALTPWLSPSSSGLALRVDL
jgi:hypothetical protein